MMNYDQAEVSKFDAMASRWWDPEGECKLLHQLNPYRLNFIQTHAPLEGKRVLDIGCGGGILAESMARLGAHVVAIDMAKEALRVAELHAMNESIPVEYQLATAEEFAQAQPGQFDIVTCMEMLEHVPEPLSIIQACNTLLKPGGHLFLSTLNRTPKAFIVAILGAEYALRMLPRGTHEYAKFIKPSELDAWCRSQHLHAEALTGLTYHPLSKTFQLSSDLSVNYLAYYQRDV